MGFTHGFAHGINTMKKKTQPNGAMVQGASELRAHPRLMLPRMLLVKPGCPGVKLSVFFRGKSTGVEWEDHGNMLNMLIM